MTDLNTLLRIAPWSLFMDEGDIDQCWEGFWDVFQAAVNECIPSNVQKNKGFCP